MDKIMVSNILLIAENRHWIDLIHDTNHKSIGVRLKYVLITDPTHCADYNRKLVEIQTILEDFNSYSIKAKTTIEYYTRLGPCVVYVIDICEVEQ